jgi:hypothetical protein
VSRFASLSCSLLLALAGSLSAAETSLITNTTPWRVWMVVGKAAFSGPDGVTPLTEETAELTRLPAGDWAGARYDDALADGPRVTRHPDPWKAWVDEMTNHPQGTSDA